LSCATRGGKRQRSTDRHEELNLLSKARLHNGGAWCFIGSSQPGVASRWIEVVDLIPVNVEDVSIDINKVPTTSVINGQPIGAMSIGNGHLGKVFLRT